MSYRNLLKMDYWFSQPYIAHDFAFWVVLIFFLGLILAGIVLFFLKSYNQDKANKVILSKLGNFGVSMGLLGLMWLFFRQQRVSFLAWRFWLLLWLLIAVWWATKILKYALKRLPQIKQEKEAKARLDKYLPNK